MSSRTAVDVLGVRIDATTPELAEGTVAAWTETKASHYVCFTPVSGVMAAQRDPAVREALNGAGLTLPDGMPMVWAGRYAGVDHIERVYGPDFMARLCALAPERDWKLFLYGGAAGVADQVRETLERRFSGIEIVGTLTPPFRPLSEAKRDEIAAIIDESGADLVWVGLSTPKQDLWMADMLPRLRRPSVLLGVGAAFDIHAGLIKQPPAWMGPIGLFWLYRLLQEPRRLGRRYLVDVPRFAVEVVRHPPSLEQGEASTTRRAAAGHDGPFSANGRRR